MDHQIVNDNDDDKLPKQAQHNKFYFTSYPTSYSSSNPFTARIQHPFSTAKSMDISNQGTLPMTHIHPLLRPRKDMQSIQTKARIKASNNLIPSQQMQSQMQIKPTKIVVDASLLTKLSTLKRTLIKMELHKVNKWSLLVPCLMIFGIVLFVTINRHHRWTPLEDRQLKGRTCVMNVFIDKLKPQEFMTDKPTTKKTTVALDPSVPTPYRSKGQMDTISRFISCVADSFRGHIDIEQAIVFGNTRDGGKLAQQSLLHWPQRGDYITQLHVIATDGDQATKYVGDMQDRFADSKEHIHMYDWELNAVEPKEHAGEDDDDDGAPEIVIDPTRRRLSAPLQISLTSVLVPDRDEPALIPYFHLDGFWKEQYILLLKAKPLLVDHTIAVIGMEHAPDLNIIEMIRFYTDLNFKTFILGTSQLIRIDNLCPEALDNILAHPSLHNDIDSPTGFFHSDPHDGATIPAFFVAMPKGRHAKEEMTIQHMYDLFSGAGGGGNVQTANDRKAPSKKK